MVLEHTNSSSLKSFTCFPRDTIHLLKFHRTLHHLPYVSKTSSDCKWFTFLGCLIIPVSSSLLHKRANKWKHYINTLLVFSFQNYVPNKTVGQPVQLKWHLTSPKVKTQRRYQKLRFNKRSNELHACIILRVKLTNASFALTLSSSFVHNVVDGKDYRVFQQLRCSTCKLCRACNVKRDKISAENIKSAYFTFFQKRWNSCKWRTPQNTLTFNICSVLIHQYFVSCIPLFQTIMFQYFM